mmetsp:Transcript_102057/g.329212  ORF Transcript_102057/g.329212 Transcript_102057/m.329212 type:complete len:175 (-) Transcript_102057:377-901(-)
MPMLYGLYVEAELCNVSSFRFSDSSDWIFQVQKRSRNGTVEPIELQQGVGRLEWGDIHGADRLACDRSEREATMRIARPRKAGSKGKGKLGKLGKLCGETPLAEYAGQGTFPRLVAVFECEGCEPLEWTTGGIACVQDENGQEVARAQLDSMMWQDPRDGEACIRITSHEFRRL